MQFNINCGPQAVPQNLFFAGSLSRPSAVFPASPVTSTLWKEKLTKQLSNTLCLVLLGEKNHGMVALPWGFEMFKFFFSNSMHLKKFFLNKDLFI